MKIFFRILLSVLLLAVVHSVCKAQEMISVMDTIKFTQTNYSPIELTLSDTLINLMSLENATAKQMNDVHFKTGGNMLRGMITLATGFGIGDAKDVDWYLTSDIQTNNPELDWKMDVYCPGNVEKQRSRVKNENGSYSLETYYVNTFLWNKGALGFIIEKNDTIGWHYVHREPRTDTAVQKWARQVYPPDQEYSLVNYQEFALLGEFTGKESSIYYNSISDRIYIFSDQGLKGIFQCQPPPPQNLFKKKKRIPPQPYLLADNSLTAWERIDLLRLAMVGLRMKSAIENL